MVNQPAHSPLTVAIVGYGRFGHFVAESMADSKLAKVVAVSDRYVLPEPNYRSLDDILADSAIDAVHIATPPASHAPLALAALKAGKHVVVDKPLALSPVEGRRVVHAAAKHDRMIAVNYILRYNPLVRTLKEVMARDLFGPLRTILVANVATKVEPPNHWFWDLKQSGGIHIEHGVHFFDAVSYLLGNDPQRTEGQLVFRDGKNTDAIAHCTYPAGVQAHFYHGFLVQDSLEHTSWRLVWDGAQADIQGWIPQRLTIRARATSEARTMLEQAGFVLKQEEPGVYEAVLALPQERQDIYASGVRSVWEEIAQAAGGRGTITASGKAGLASLATARAASRRRAHL